jgi:hypothetical protein
MAHLRAAPARRSSHRNKFQEIQGFEHVFSDGWVVTGTAVAFNVGPER